MAKGAPIRAVSPLTATEIPNWSNSTPSEARSLACCVQSPPASRTKLYTAPESVPRSSSPGAPSTAVSSNTATDAPKRSPASPSAAVSLATCCHSPPVVTVLSKTYAAPRSLNAAPRSLKWWGAPNKSHANWVPVKPLMVLPNQSPNTPSSAASLTTCCQSPPVVTVLSKTYAAPDPGSRPSAKIAPITARSPKKARPVPKKSKAAPSSAVSLATCVHSSLIRSKTYTAPVLGSRPWAKGAPTSTVSPSMATDAPNKSAIPPSFAMSLATSSQPPSVFS